MKFLSIVDYLCTAGSPLAEGRELKCITVVAVSSSPVSPLAEGRELKFSAHDIEIIIFVAPRGGA